jgi:hypothetical protein
MSASSVKKRQSMATLENNGSLQQLGYPVSLSGGLNMAAIHERGNKNRPMSAPKYSGIKHLRAKGNSAVRLRMSREGDSQQQSAAGQTGTFGLVPPSESVPHAATTNALNEEEDPAHTAINITT